MFIEVEVSESANCPMSLTRVFDAMGVPIRVSRVMASDPYGQDHMCDVTGWSASGECSAYAVLVEDSGEGVAMLIYGGDEGIRLKPVGCQDAWDLNSPHQWGEACLLLDKDAKSEPA
ncbi:MAG: hypothetical protein J4F46_06890 [Dehalococcoidia bacterium]|nr:hypothetical protein [Dehalococcoidia bacterium]